MPQHSFSRLPFAPRKGIALPRSKKRRSGISLLEVLFSMLLVTVGLFGAIALLPVAAQQAKRGRTADMQSVAGESAVSEFFVRDMNRAATWVAPSNPTHSPIDNPTNVAPTNANSFFTVRYTYVDSSGMPQIGQRPFFPAFGYCIDPMFVASSSVTFGPQGNQGNSRYFPYYLRDASTATDSSYAVRMERITIGNNRSGGGAISLQHALSIFAFDDDLFLDRVNDATVPASQIYSQLRTTMPPTNLRRFSENQLTWFATLAPRNVVGSDRAPDDYVLSVVVVYKRPITGLSVDTDFSAGSTDVAPPERLVDVESFPGSGIGGGEVVLQYRTGRGVGDLTVQAGDWLMLSGSTISDTFINYGNLTVNGQTGCQWNSGSTTASPGANPVAQSAMPAAVPGIPVPHDRRPVYQWYRVVDADTDITGPSLNQRVVTLAGPDWSIPAGQAQATLMTGVVAVYEKSVRLNFK
jgi:hypothetical protein